MDIREAIKHIFDGQAILFTGAGFSLGCTNINEQDFTSAKGLKNRLGEALGLSDVGEYSLPLLSNSFIKRQGELELISFLKKEFKVKEIEPYHTAVINQNWKRVYTANYDDVAEFIHINNKKEFISVTPQDNADEHASKKNLIVHLNGYIENMYPENLRNYVKLTNESYANDTLKESKWGNLLSLDIQNAKAIFFLGFSLNYDLDISRIISANDELKSKLFFINGKMNDQILIEDLEIFGTVTELGTKEFSEMILEEKSKYIPKENLKGNLLSFDKIKNESHLIEVKDNDIMHLFFKGNSNEKLLQRYCDTPANYSVIRDKEFEVIQAVNNTNINLIILHAAFGNGKTLFVESLKYRLAKQGKDVFIYNGNISFFSDDIEKLNDYESDNKVVIIEDYYAIKSELDKLLALDKSKITLIVTGRSSIHFNTKQELYRNTGYTEIKSTSISLDDVSNSEINQLFQLIDSHGFWGDKAYLNNRQKKALLKNNARRGFSHLMFEVLKSNGLLKRLGDIYSNITFKTSKEIIIASVIVNVLRSSLQLRDILFILDRVNLSESQVNEPGFKEFIDIDKNKIKLKSGIASKNLLNKYVQSDELLLILIKLFKNANNYNVGNRYDYFCRELVSFSNFKMLFNGKSEDVLSKYSLEYYESIKNTSFAKKNHFFWLQYAIQKLEQKEYDLAGIYFRNAYSLATAKNTKYDTYQIDTHYARYQLEKTINTNLPVDEVIENFKDAHYKLMNSNEGLVKHYSIRQAGYYKDLLDKYEHQLDINQIFYVTSCSKEMLNTTYSYIDACKGNKNIEWYVPEVKKKLEKIVNTPRETGIK